MNIIKKIIRKKVLKEERKMLSDFIKEQYEKDLLALKNKNK